MSKPPIEELGIVRLLAPFEDIAAETMGTVLDVYPDTCMVEFEGPHEIPVTVPTDILEPVIRAPEGLTKEELSAWIREWFGRALDPANRIDVSDLTSEQFVELLRSGKYAARE